MPDGRFWGLPRKPAPRWGLHFSQEGTALTVGDWRWTDEQGVQRLVGTDELRAALSNRILSPSTLVWREGMKEWAPAVTMPELASAALAPARAARARSSSDMPPRGPAGGRNDPLSPTEAPALEGLLSEPSSPSLDPKVPAVAVPRPGSNPPPELPNHAHRQTLVGLSSPGNAHPTLPSAPITVPARDGARLGSRPSLITQAPYTGGDTPVPSIPVAPKLPAPLSERLAFGRRKVRTSEIDALWASPPSEDSNVDSDVQSQSHSDPVGLPPHLGAAPSAPEGVETAPTDAEARGKGAANADALPTLKGRVNADPLSAVKGTANADPLAVAKIFADGEKKPAGAAQGSEVKPSPLTHPRRTSLLGAPAATAALAQNAGGMPPKAPPGAPPLRKPPLPRSVVQAPAVSHGSEAAKRGTSLSGEPEAPVRAKRFPLPPLRKPAVLEVPPDPTASTGGGSPPPFVPRLETPAHALSSILVTATPLTPASVTHAASTPPGEIPAAPAVRGLVLDATSPRSLGDSAPNAGSPAAGGDLSEDAEALRAELSDEPAEAAPAGRNSGVDALPPPAGGTQSEPAPPGSPQLHAESAAPIAAALSEAEAQPGASEPERARAPRAVPQELADRPALRDASRRRGRTGRLGQPVLVPLSSLLGVGGFFCVGLVLMFFVGRCSVNTAEARDEIVAQKGLARAPRMAKAALPTPAKPCWVAKQPVMWASQASKNIPFELAATTRGTIAVGYARGNDQASGIEFDLNTGEVQERFSQKTEKKIERVAPIVGETLSFVISAVEGGAGSRSVVHVAAVPSFVFVLDKSGVAVADTPDGAVTMLWPLSDGEAPAASRVVTAGSEGYALTFRRNNSIWSGWVGADRKPIGALANVVGSGGSVGKPNLGWNAKDLAVVFADRPEGARWEIRVGQAPKGAASTETRVIPIPKGGPGGDAFAPDIAGLADGRWLLVWTEGATGNRAIRALTLAPDLSPVGDPIALSPPAGNFGQGVLGISGNYAATVFLSKGEASYELWGAILQCG